MFRRETALGQYHRDGAKIDAGSVDPTTYVGSDWSTGYDIRRSPSQCTIGWNDDRAALTKQLWCDGLSASHIAARLGGTTRNAVIGKIHRMGLSNHFARRVNPCKPGPRPASTSHRPKRPRKAVTSSAQQADLAARQGFIEAVRAAPDLVIPPAERKTLHILNASGRLCANDDFTHKHCHWPFGDPGHADFHYCGKDAKPGLSYCEFHAARASNPPRMRERTAKPLPRDMAWPGRLATAGSWRTGA